MRTYLIKKVFLISAVVGIVLVGLLYGAYLVITRYYHVDPQFVYELTQPPKEDIAELLPQGVDLDSPISVPSGFRLAIFTDLKSFGLPRVLEFSSQGILFASLTKAGKVVALPDKDNDGIADQVVEIVDNLNSPHGIAFSGGYIYIAETDKVVRYDYNPSDFSINNSKTLFTLPGGGRHFTRTIKILGNKLYTSVGSSCDVCLEKDEERAALLVSNLNGGELKVFARGLRNTVFFDFDEDGRIWGNDMGRDFLGDNLPPDELNLIEEGKDYGWPRCYGKQVRDIKFRGLEPFDTCPDTEPAIYDYPAHVAPLGVAVIKSRLFSDENQGNILSAFHGSWNSTVPVGYSIVILKVERNVEGVRVLEMEDFITGWLKGSSVLGRPVDLKFGPNGVLYISDDKAGVVYILTK